MNNKVFFSSGKVILSGEHSVVYGQPALVSAINLGIKAFVVDGYNNKEIQIPNYLLQKREGYLKHIFNIFEEKYFNKDFSTDDLEIYSSSNLPRRSGLGSSAAFAHVIFLCLLDYFNTQLSEKEIFKLVQKAEKYVHGNSSGADPSAVVFGGTQVFENGERIKLISDVNLNFTLVNSGLTAENTGKMVGFVRSKVNSSDSNLSDKTMETIEKIGEITTEIIKSIEYKRFDPIRITKNQRLLEELGVVGEKAKIIISDIESLGGFAKITGAGGIKNGSGWLLVYHPDENKLNEFLAENTMENHQIEVK